MSPKDRMQDAGHRLAGAAERLEETIDDIALYPQNFEIARSRVTEGLKEVRQITTEIEEIVK